MRNKKFNVLLLLRRRVKSPWLKRPRERSDTHVHGPAHQVSFLYGEGNSFALIQSIGPDTARAFPIQPQFPPLNYKIRN